MLDPDLRARGRRSPHRPPAARRLNASVRVHRLRQVAVPQGRREGRAATQRPEIRRCSTSREAPPNCWRAPRAPPGCWPARRMPRVRCHRRERRRVATASPTCICRIELALPLQRRQRRGGVEFLSRQCRLASAAFFAKLAKAAWLLAMHCRGQRAALERGLVRRQRAERACVRAERREGRGVVRVERRHCIGIMRERSRTRPDSRPSPNPCPSAPHL